MSMTSRYSQMDEMSRKELLSTIASIAHQSDEFLEKIIGIVQEYDSFRKDKVGYQEISKLNP